MSCLENGLDLLLEYSHISHSLLEFSILCRDLLENLVDRLQRVLQVWVHDTLLHFYLGQDEVDVTNRHFVAEEVGLVFQNAVEDLGVYFVFILNKVEFF